MALQTVGVSTDFKSARRSSGIVASAIRSMSGLRGRVVLASEAAQHLGLSQGAIPRSSLAPSDGVQAGGGVGRPTRALVADVGGDSQAVPQGVGL